MRMRYTRTDERAREPHRGSKLAAGYDLYAVVPRGVMVIKPHETEVVHTCITVEIPPGHFGAIFARSGLATKRGLRPSNCVGVIDEDYRGEVLVATYNDSEETQIIYNGDRIAQMIVIPYATIEWQEVSELTKTDRGTGGFGSTGA